MTRRLALSISILLHPLLLPSYLFACLFGFVPEIMGVSILDLSAQGSLLLLIFLNTFLLPSICIYYLYRARYIPSMHMNQPEDRRLPYMVTVILYMATTYVLKFKLSPISEMAPRLAAGLGGITFSLLVVLLVNRYWKISAHATGIGGVIGIIGCVLFKFNTDMLLFPMLGWILIGGFLCSARLYLNAHTPAQILAGLGTGIISAIFTVFFWF